MRTAPSDASNSRDDRRANLFIAWEHVRVTRRREAAPNARCVGHHRLDKARSLGRPDQPCPPLPHILRPDRGLASAQVRSQQPWQWEFVLIRSRNRSTAKRAFVSTATGRGTSPRPARFARTRQGPQARVSQPLGPREVHHSPRDGLIRQRCAGQPPRYPPLLYASCLARYRSPRFSLVARHLPPSIGRRQRPPNATKCPHSMRGSSTRVRLRCTASRLRRRASTRPSTGTTSRLSPRTAPSRST